MYFIVLVYNWIGSNKQAVASRELLGTCKKVSLCDGRPLLIKLLAEVEQLLSSLF